MISGFGHFDVLDEAECRELLRTHSMGRVGWESSTGPQVLPVTYRILDGDLVFLSSADSVLAELRTGARVAFEVDTLDAETRTGWSVLARGTSSSVEGAAARKRWGEDGPQPWIRAGRDLMIRVAIDEVSGRVVVADD